MEIVEVVAIDLGVPTWPACSLDRSHLTSTQEVLALDEAHTTLLAAALLPKGPLMWFIDRKAEGSLTGFDPDKASRLLKLRLIYPLPSQWELIAEYGAALTDTLRREGYDAKLVIDTTLPAIHGAVVLIPVEGWDTDITIMYCHRYLHSSETIPEYLLQVDTTTWYIIGLEHVLNRLSNMRLHRQCMACYYVGDTSALINDGRHYCGIGLVSTGECSHYMGAPHTNNQHT